jgi:hypothetical protein
VIDEYGDVPGQGGSQYATVDTILPDTDLHTKGTIRRRGNIEFWLTSPKPKDVSVEEWEKYTQERWDRAFTRSEQ